MAGKLIVVGGGPAGMMAAITAARRTFVKPRSWRSGCLTREPHWWE